MLEGNEGEGGQAGSKGANKISFVGEILSGSIRESFVVRLGGNEEEGGQGCRACPHKRPYVGVSQGTVLGFGDGFGAILWETVANS